MKKNNNDDQINLVDIKPEPLTSNLEFSLTIPDDTQTTIFKRSIRSMFNDAVSVHLDDHIIRRMSKTKHSKITF